MLEKMKEFCATPTFITCITCVMACMIILGVAYETTIQNDKLDFRQLITDHGDPVSATVHFEDGTYVAFIWDKNRNTFMPFRGVLGPSSCEPVGDD